MTNMNKRWSTWSKLKQRDTIFHLSKIVAMIDLNFKYIKNYKSGKKKQKNEKNTWTDISQKHMPNWQNTYEKVLTLISHRGITNPTRGAQMRQRRKKTISIVGENMEQLECSFTGNFKWSSTLKNCITVSFKSEFMNI